MKPINLSPSFLIKVYEKGYDYAVGEKLGLFPHEDTSAMSDGRLIHALISERLGGEKAKIAIMPFDNFRTNAAKEWRDSQPDDTSIVTEEKIETLNKIIDRLVDHEKLEKFLSNPCLTELVVEKQVNGHNVKGILDLVSTDDETTTVIDWKFVSTQVFDSFSKKALYQHYDLQAAIYDYLKDATNIYFVAIENQAPYRIKVFHCDSSFLESGAEKFNKAFKIIDEAKGREPNFNINVVEELIAWDQYNG
jgi:hypothetical protein